VLKEEHHQHIMYMLDRGDISCGEVLNQETSLSRPGIQMGFTLYCFALFAPNVVGNIVCSLCAVNDESHGLPHAPI
jgi:hypothetical protein